MKILRFLLLPFAIIYALVVFVRNGMYQIKWFRSTKFSVPTINVGNLSMGGTGKTPHIEYLIRLLKDENNVATLSRGFGRKTQGYRLANDQDNAETIGDEPYQYFRKFSPEISVAVDPKRVLGLVDLMRDKPDTNLVLLDDAFQHRSITAGLNILLTTYESPFSSDFILPVGNLREFKNGKKRADIIVISKCPENANKDVLYWSKKLGLNKDFPLFFSNIKYGEIKPINDHIPSFNSVILVTGIANANPLKNYLSKNFVVLHHFNFNDHHIFKEQDLAEVHNLFDKFAKEKQVAIITTEKDAMRLMAVENKKRIADYPWCFQEIETTFEKPEEFNALIQSYVQKANSSNGVSFS